MIPLGVLASARAGGTASVDLTYAGGYAAEYATDVPIGTATSARTVVVIAGTHGDAPPTDCTIGGVTATRDYYYTGGGRALSAFRATVPAGTTAAVTLAGGGPTGFGVWVSGIAITPHDTQLSGLGNSVSVTVATVPDGSIAAHAASDSGAGGHSWTGVTERYDLLRSSGGDAATTGADVAVGHNSWSVRILAIAYKPAA